MEQLLFARTVEGTGAARVVEEDINTLPAAVDDVLCSVKYRTNARAFAQRYSGLVPGTQVPEIADHIEHHITSSRAG